MLPSIATPFAPKAPPPHLRDYHSSLAPIVEVDETAFSLLENGDTIEEHSEKISEQFSKFQHLYEKQRQKLAERALQGSKLKVKAARKEISSLNSFRRKMKEIKKTIKDLQKVTKNSAISLPKHHPIHKNTKHSLALIKQTDTATTTMKTHYLLVIEAIESLSISDTEDVTLQVAKKRIRYF